MHPVPVPSGPARAPRRRPAAARWLAVGAAVVAFGGASVAAASAPPTDAPPESGSGSAPAGLPGTCAALPAESVAGDTTASATLAAPDTMAAGDAPTDSAAAPDGPFVQTAESEYGTILVDAECRTLYGFTKDTDGESRCVEGCATAWPALSVADGTMPALEEGLDASLFSIVEHPESGPMLKIGDWPLYYFASDVAPGDMNGQGLNGVWWVVAPDGSLIETAPPGTDAADSAATATATEAMGSEPSASAGY